VSETLLYVMIKGREENETSFYVELDRR
jgi:hypothetical protein